MISVWWFLHDFSKIATWACFFFQFDQIFFRCVETTNGGACCVEPIGSPIQIVGSHMEFYDFGDEIYPGP